MRGTRYLSAWRQTVSDCGSTPATESNSAIAPSSTRSERSTSTVKSTWPGVSMMLMRWSRQTRGGRGGRDRDAALLLLLHPVHDGSALVDLAHLVGAAGVEEDALGRRRLTGVDVGHDPDVAGLVECDLRAMSCPSMRFGLSQAEKRPVRARAAWLSPGGGSMCVGVSMRRDRTAAAFLRPRAQRDRRSSCAAASGARMLAGRRCPPPERDQPSPERAFASPSAARLEVLVSPAPSADVRDRRRSRAMWRGPLRRGGRVRRPLTTSAASPTASASPASWRWCRRWPSAALGAAGRSACAARAGRSPACLALGSRPPVHKAGVIGQRLAEAQASRGSASTGAPARA